MKKIIVLIAALAAAVSLCACGGGGGSQNQTQAQGGGEASETQASAKGTAYDTEVFTFNYDDSAWMVVPQTDMFGEKDADGNYPVDPTKICLIKGGKSEWDAFTKPAFYINYYDDELTDLELDWGTSWYDESEEFDYSANGVKCNAYHCKNDEYEYDIVFYPISDNEYFQINVNTNVDEKNPITIADADITAIVESLKVD